MKLVLCQFFWCLVYVMFRQNYRLSVIIQSGVRIGGRLHSSGRRTDKSHQNLHRTFISNSYGSIGTTRNVRNTHSDVTIIGGNLIGSAAAAAIASSIAFTDRKVTLIERREIRFPEDLDRWSNRVYAITPGTKDFLVRIAVWQKLKPKHIHVCRRMFIWENFSDAALHFTGEARDTESNAESDVVCYNIDQHTLLYAIYERLKELPNIEIRDKTRITKTYLPTNGLPKLDSSVPEAGHKPVCLEILGADEVHTTDMLVAADGFNSQIRKLMGVQNVSWSYKQKSIIAVVDLDGLSDVDGTAFQRFIPDGVVALLPLGNKQACLIWSLVDPAAEYKLKMANEEFVDALNEQLHGTLDYNEAVMSVLYGTQIIMNSVGLLKSNGKTRVNPPRVVGVQPHTRASYPLGMGHAVQYVVPRAALVGDSAHRVHPLAGQGANFGFADVECLTRHLEAAAFRGERLGSFNTLQAYERERQCALLPFQVAIESLIHIYQNNKLPVVLARSLGVQLLDALPYLKHKVVQYASR
ncbi:ubiquinone biosynthesis monooxygenase COQ6, mitochondrial-like isoform X1 [Varroa jacobsoni]|uniref:ubiquinone biosynthesis monooxygenase COQ6, mitochondrial-like isoform X1 n=1 Tax=Varroa jacobsoni TaxID=62625 RepID=UPI000BF3A16E|nr:ubiquinone biosynthesis monooxygenase COQ6, mitochondrial-like isoform X1 [Varroa jacobsoni]